MGPGLEHLTSQPHCCSITLSSGALAATLPVSSQPLHSLPNPSLSTKFSHPHPLFILTPSLLTFPFGSYHWALWLSHSQSSIYSLTRIFNLTHGQISAAGNLPLISSSFQLSCCPGFFPGQATAHGLCLPPPCPPQPSDWLLRAGELLVKGCYEFIAIG